MIERKSQIFKELDSSIFLFGCYVRCWRNTSHPSPFLQWAFQRNVRSFLVLNIWKFQNKFVPLQCQNVVRGRESFAFIA